MTRDGALGVAMAMGFGMLFWAAELIKNTASDGVLDSPVLSATVERPQAQ